MQLENEEKRVRARKLEYLISSSFEQGPDFEEGLACTAHRRGGKEFTSLKPVFRQAALEREEKGCKIYQLLSPL